jgi:hypothetical protein
LNFKILKKLFGPKKFLKLKKKFTKRIKKKDITKKIINIVLHIQFFFFLYRLDKKNNYSYGYEILDLNIFFKQKSNHI